jgi:ABC-type transport system involved in cytochrome bd biosynthesis fused ATPase/permease subunit
MQYDLVIKRTLREAQGILWANLPPASNLPDAQAVKSLRALVRAPQVHQALERDNEDQPNATINQLWDVLDQPELNRALRQNSRMILGQKKPPAR